MALWVCADCPTAYAVGLSACPQCQSTDHHEEGAMPKITIHGGPTNEAARGRTEWVGEPGPELLSPPDDLPVIPATPEEEPSPGSSSKTSSTKPPTSTKKSANARRSPAPTTENPSATDPTASSTAAGTDGDPTAATSATDATK